MSRRSRRRKRGLKALLEGSSVLFAPVLLLVAAQCLFLLVDGDSFSSDLFGISCTLLTIAVGLWWRRRRWPWLAALFALGFVVNAVVFGIHLAQVTPPFAWRLLQVLMVLGYLGVLITPVVKVLLITSWPRALWATGTLASVTFLIEIASGLSLDRESQEPEHAIPAITPGATYNPVVDAHMLPPKTVTSLTYPDDPRGYFDNLAVEFRSNSLGCRGPDYAVPKPPGTIRIVMLGDERAWGMGVHESDVVGSRLEAMLNASRQNLPGNASVEVINCGVRGFGTEQERLFYEVYAAKYDPDLVLVVMAWDDDRLAHDNGQANDPQSQGRLEHLFHAWQLMMSSVNVRSAANFAQSVEALKRLAISVQRHGGRLALLLFRTDDEQAEWRQLRDALQEDNDIAALPFRDLGPALLARRKAGDLRVHELDPSPNEIAHEIAAFEIASFIETGALLTPAPALGHVPIPEGSIGCFVLRDGLQAALRAAREAGYSGPIGRQLSPETVDWLEEREVARLMEVEELAYLDPAPLREQLTVTETASINEYVYLVIKPCPTCDQDGAAAPSGLLDRICLDRRFLFPERVQAK